MKFKKLNGPSVRMYVTGCRTAIHETSWLYQEFTLGLTDAVISGNRGVVIEMITGRHVYMDLATSLMKHSAIDQVTIVTPHETIIIEGD